MNPLPSQMAQFLQLPNMEAGTSKQVNQSPPTSTFKKMSLNSLNPDHSRPEQNTMTNLITRPIGHLSKILLGKKSINKLKNVQKFK